MKITRLETIWIDEQPNTVWLRIHTDDGLIGLGETFYVPRAVSAVIHDVFATLLIERSPCGGTIRPDRRRGAGCAGGRAARARSPAAARAARDDHTAHRLVFRRC
jgi:L-alanine-DL-glutamate epimerase-like enolase superfamily enzyme